MEIFIKGHLSVQGASERYSTFKDEKGKVKLCLFAVM